MAGIKTYTSTTPNVWRFPEWKENIYYPAGSFVSTSASNDSDHKFWVSIRDVPTSNNTLPYNDTLRQYWVEAWGGGYTTVAPDSESALIVFGPSAPEPNAVPGRIWYNTTTGNYSYADNDSDWNAISIRVQPAAPTVAVDDDSDTLWYDTTAESIKRWDGQEWIEPNRDSDKLFFSVGAPAGDSEALWINTATNVISRWWDGAWIPLTAASSISVGDEVPDSDSDGIWLDTTANTFKRFNSATNMWEAVGGTSISVGDDAPDSDSDGLWVDTTANAFKRFNTATNMWEIVGGANIPVSDDAPTVDSDQLWIDTTTNTLKRYNTATSMWDVIGGTDSDRIWFRSTAPDSDIQSLWVDTTNNTIKRYDDTTRTWEPLGTSIPVQTTAPDSEADALWYDKANDILKRFDSDANAWVPTESSDSEIMRSGTMAADTDPGRGGEVVGLIFDKVFNYTNYRNVKWFHNGTLTTGMVPAGLASGSSVYFGTAIYTAGARFYVESEAPLDAGDVITIIATGRKD